MCPEGRCYLQRPSVSCCKSEKGHRQEITQVMERRNSCCSSTKAEMSSTLGSLCTSAMEMPSTSEYILYSAVLTFSMSILKRSAVTTGELMGRWTPMGLSVNFCFRVLTSACPRLDAPRCLTKENLEGEVIH